MSQPSRRPPLTDFFLFLFWGEIVPYLNALTCRVRAQPSWRAFLPFSSGPLTYSTPITRVSSIQSNSRLCWPSYSAYFAWLLAVRVLCARRCIYLVWQPPRQLSPMRGRPPFAMPSRGSILLADDRTGWGAHGTLQYDPSRRAIRDRPHVPIGRCRQQRRDQLSRVHRPHHILRGRDGLATDLPGATRRDRRERDRDDEAYKQI